MLSCLPDRFFLWPLVQLNTIKMIGIVVPMINKILLPTRDQDRSEKRQTTSQQRSVRLPMAKNKKPNKPTEYSTVL